MQPLIVVCNKIDIVPLDKLSDENKNALSVFERENIPVLSMSTVTDEGIMEVKQTVCIAQLLINQRIYETCTLFELMNLRFHLKFLKACDTLLQYRIENKILAKKVDTMLNRLHVAVPQQRDNKERPPYIPGASVWFFKSCIRVYYSCY